MKLFTVDAFTDHPFAGNPAAVCVLEEAKPDEWMQQLAQEINYSETAFVQIQDHGYGLRWFTPVREVELCGHATLATAHVLWTEMDETAVELNFHTKSGILVARRFKDLVELDFPVTPAVEREPDSRHLAALGVNDIVYSGMSKFDAILVVDSEASLRDVTPDFQRLADVRVRGTMITAAADAKDVDFLSRFFAPACGVNEDPVTGSAHCCLADYWGKRLGKSELVGYQASNRGGTVHVKLAGERVLLRGKAVTIVRGELAIR